MKVLIIQQKMIGDVLTSSLLFEVIKTKHPNAELHYLINSHTIPVVENNPYIDRFVCFTPKIEKSTKALLRLAKDIKKENYDSIIDVYSKLSSNIICLFSNSKYKISKYKWYSSFIYTHTFKDLDYATTKAGLAIENRLQLLKPLGLFAKPKPPKIHLKTHEKESAKNYLTSNGIVFGKPLFMIAVLGSGDHKTYPYDQMAKVIDAIATILPTSQLLFNYIPSQEEKAKTILSLCHKNTQSKVFFNIYGKNLRDFLAITHHCDALIGNEGGATNMAKALQVPTFTIFSPWIKKEAWNMFEDGKKHASVHLKDYDQSAYKGVLHEKELKNNYKALYRELQPHLFSDKLSVFLKHIS